MIKGDPKSKIMNSRLFHLKDVGCKIVNCTQVAKKENMTNKTIKIKTKSKEIDISLCIKLFTNIKSFGPSPLRPPLCGPLLLYAPAELVLK